MGGHLKFGIILDSGKYDSVRILNLWRGETEYSVDGSSDASNFVRLGRERWTSLVMFWIS